MIGRRLLAAAATAWAAAALAAGCAARPKPRTGPSPEWIAALSAAELEATAGRFGAADSVLASFAAAHSASPDTLDALFWRAMYLADPANRADSAATAAISFVERYLNAQAPQPRRYEAEVIRRVVALRNAPPRVRVDTVTVVDSSAARAAAAARELEARDKLREEELQRLRDSLARTTAELDRIRRRLAPQRP